MSIFDTPTMTIGVQVQTWKHLANNEIVFSDQ